MELRVLRYFLTIVRKGSITHAANSLHITQPTLSRQIRDLEEELGQKLFTRSNYSMILTPEGMVLKKRAEEIIALVDKAEAEFYSMGNEVSGDIYIGGGETKSMKAIADIMKKLQTSYPSIHYHLYSGNSEDVTERLDKGLLDFGILIQPADIAKYDYINLPTKDTWGVIMRKDSPLAQKETIRKEDLLELPLICSRQAIMRKWTNNEFTAWFGNDFEKLHIVSTFNLVYNASIMAEAGIGYVIAFDKIVTTTANSSLCFKPLEPRLESGMAIVWKKDQVFSRPAELFLKTLRESLVKK
ncbi:LysR family transcriptional regulator [uncultured Megasphaera sp.]|uniref:LysR family transcriptional regulator n=1 Tax=Megasphaera massiliensis TaxID=1232428 RepID=UPI00266BFEFC|nr:LysR family transcriptional regulator [uncultured Megasphaera sp.]